MGQLMLLLLVLTSVHLIVQFQFMCGMSSVNDEAKTNITVIQTQLITVDMQLTQLTKRISQMLQGERRPKHLGKMTADVDEKPIGYATINVRASKPNILRMKSVAERVADLKETDAKLLSRVNDLEQNMDKMNSELVNVITQTVNNSTAKVIAFVGGSVKAMEKIWQQALQSIEEHLDDLTPQMQDDDAHP